MRVGLEVLPEQSGPGGWAILLHSSFMSGVNSRVMLDVGEGGFLGGRERGVSVFGLKKGEECKVGPAHLRQVF
jgi:hypothetical protein